MSNANQLKISDATLDKLMLLFWERGYFNTSIQDLVDATGVNRAAIYRHFGGKQGLFHIMLQRFRSKVVDDAVLPLTDPSQGMDGLKKFFLQFTQCNIEIVTSHGCFMLAVAATLPQDEPEAASVIDEFILYLRALFYKNLRWQQSEKTLDTECNTEMTADFLVGNVVGLMTLLRSGADPHILQNHVTSVINFISSLPVRKGVLPHHLHLIS